MDHISYHTRKLEEIAQGDQDFVNDMVVTFTENVTAEIKHIQSFRAAENWKSIAEAAHKLASNFAYLGADSLHDLAADIEKSVIIEHNLTGIANKTDQLCHDGLILLNQVKKDFCITSVN